MLKHAWGSKRETKKTITIMENNQVIETLELTLKQRSRKMDQLKEQGYTRIAQDRWGFTYSK